MNHEADVGLVNAHAESDGGGDNWNVAVDEPLLGDTPGFGVQTGVIGYRRMAGSGQPFCYLFRFLARKAIDDCRLPAPFPQQVHQRIPCGLARLHPVPQVSPVKTGYETRTVVQLQLPNNVIPNPLRSRSRQRHHRAYPGTLPEVRRVRGSPGESRGPTR